MVEVKLTYRDLPACFHYLVLKQGFFESNVGGVKQNYYENIFFCKINGDMIVICHEFLLLVLLPSCGGYCNKIFIVNTNVSCFIS